MNSDKPLEMMEVYLNAVLILVKNAKHKDESVEGLVLQESLLSSLKEKLAIAHSDVRTLMENAMTGEMIN